MDFLTLLLDELFFHLIISIDWWVIEQRVLLFVAFEHLLLFFEHIWLNEFESGLRLCFFTGLWLYCLIIALTSLRFCLRFLGFDLICFIVHYLSILSLLDELGRALDWFGYLLSLWYWRLIWRKSLCLWL